MKTVLVAEDEEAIRDFVVINLERAGYEVVEADSGTAALDVYEQYGGDFDIAVLDIMMPGMDGLQVCKELRRRSSYIGIILLTAKTQEMDKVAGLSTGADDYVTKPFSPTELVARVDALYRRISAAQARRENNLRAEVRSGDFIINLRNHTLMKRGRFIELTHVEFQLMEYFFANPGAALDRGTILNQIWGDDYNGDEKIVDVNIRRLRSKIEDNPSKPEHIVTVWGLGYRWET